MDDTLKDALERFRESQDGSEFNRQDWYDDIKFGRLSEQWPAKVQKQRQEEGRPCLTINKLPPAIRQVVNDSRQNKPGIKVSPVDGGADVETAEVISGLIRSVERNGTGADVAYDTAIEQAVSGGFGFFRIAIDYAHPDSFDLECKIERIPNALQVHWDVTSTAFDASDWEYAFVSDFYTEDAFKKKWPKAAAVSFEGGSRDANVDDWVDEGKIRVAEYWLRTEKTRQLIQFARPDGSLVAIREDSLPAMAKSMAQAGGIDLSGLKDDDLAAMFVALNGLEERRRREVEYFEVTRRIMSGVEVLDADPWPGSTIPICPVWGEEVFLDGRRYFRSMIRDAKGPQEIFNFWRSASTELVALAPRAPFMIEENGLPSNSQEAAKWAQANNRSFSYLMYRGQMPRREQFASAPAGALQEAMNASDDIKAITGIYDASLGARSNETSGKAILARQKEGDVANFHFIDNLARAIRYAGQVLVEIIPSVYGPREAIRILGEDMKEKVVKLTQEDGGAMLPGIEGEPRLYNLAVGKYDVTVTSGPSYSTQREETRETLIEIMRQVPDSAPVLGDVLLEHMDFAGADKVAKRLQALLPPAVQMAEGIAPPQGMPGQAPQAMPGQTMPPPGGVG